MRIWFGALLVLACVIFCGSTARAAINIAREGKTTYVIVIGDDANDVAKYAAGQLQDYLKQVTAAQLSIVTESAIAGGDAPKIIVGDTKLTRRLLPQFDENALGSDGIVIKSVGDNIILTGGRSRGVLYAVNTFLEDNV